MIGFWLKALTRPTLDLTLATHAGLETRIVERPGAVLDDEDLAALVGKLRSVASRTLDEGALTYGVFSGERERLAQTVVTLITDKASGRAIAFNALAEMKVPLDGDTQTVTHLGLVMVDPEARGRGLSWVLYGLTVLVLFVRGGLRPRWISNVTQVPGVVGMVCQTFSEVYPSPDPGSRQSFAHLTLARRIMRDHRHVFGVGPEAGFDEVRSVIADIDVFEVSNLNRQVFANVATIGRSKAEAAAEAARAINPTVEIEVLGAEWSERLPEIAARCPIIVNGMDDIAAGLHLYRTAKAAGATVIDAYMSPLPSVIVVRPDDPRPEERLGFPTLGKDWRALGEDDRRAALFCEVEHVMLHSRSRHHVDLAIAAEVAAGRRSRMSFAPMVITTGMLMADEAIALALGRRSGTDCRGWFFNPHRPAVEKPLPAPLAALLRPFVRRALRRMMAGP